MYAIGNSSANYELKKVAYFGFKQKELSAEKVKEYYQSKGIKASRIKVASYGEDMPIDSRNHANNRRVVTRVLGKVRKKNY